MSSKENVNSALARLIDLFPRAIGDPGSESRLWLSSPQNVYAGEGPHPEFPLVDIQWDLSVQMARTEIERDLQAITPFYTMTCRVVDCAFASYPNLRSPIVTCTSGPFNSIDLAVAKVSSMVISYLKNRYFYDYGLQSDDVFFAKEDADVVIRDEIRTQMMRQRTLT